MSVDETKKRIKEVFTNVVENIKADDTVISKYFSTEYVPRW